MADKPVLLVLASADDPYVPMLGKIRTRAEIHIGDTAQALAEHAAQARTFAGMKSRLSSPAQPACAGCMSVMPGSIIFFFRR